MGDPVQDRVAALHRVLVETEDDSKRAAAHVELASISMENKRIDLAIRHLREALLLDPDLENARRWLRSLGEPRVVPEEKAKVTSRLSGLLTRAEKKLKRLMQ